MDDTSKEVELYKRMASELTYAADKLFEAKKNLMGIRDAEASANFCLDNLFQPFSRIYYNDTEKFLDDFDRLKDLTTEAGTLMLKLERAMSSRATDFNRRIVKLMEEEE